MHLKYSVRRVNRLRTYEKKLGTLSMFQFINQHGGKSVNFKLTLFRVGFFGVAGRAGGGLQMPPPSLHKSKCFDAIVMKLEGEVEHYYLINCNRIHAIMRS